MIIDILNNILKNSKFEEQINVHNLNKYTSEHIFIFKLSLLPYKIFPAETIHQRKYSKLAILLCPNNSNITDVNHLKNTLIELDCSGTKNGINQKGLADLKALKILDCSFNNKINDVTHLTSSLEELYCDYELSNYITNENKNKNKCTSRTFSISRIGISHVYNENSNKKKFKNILNKNGTLKTISQKDIDVLHKLRILSCENNMNIKNVNNLTNTLEKLYCRGIYCGINQEGISKLKKLTLLDCHGNKKIYDANIFRDTLVELYCGGKCGIKQKNIDELVYLKKLNCASNSSINNIDNFMLDEIYCELSGINSYISNNIKKMLWHRKIY